MSEPDLYAACLACFETWTISVDEPWLPVEDASHELRREAHNHDFAGCPVKRAGFEIGVVGGIPPVSVGATG